MIMRGERTGREFRLGDEVKVKVTNVTVEESSIDFEIVGMKGSRRRNRPDVPKVIKTGSDTSKPRRNKQGARNQEGQHKSGNGSKSKKKRKFYENVPKSKSTKRKKRR